MGKVKKISLLAFFGLIVLVTINRHYQKQKDPILFRIYQAAGYENSMLQLLGIIPPDFKNIYSSKIIETEEDYRLKKIFRTNQSLVEVGYLLDANDKEEFIVAFLYPLIRNQNLSGITFENHLNYLLDLEMFNTYLLLSQLKDLDGIIEKLAFFYAEGFEYRKIGSYTDLNSLKEEYEKKYGEIPDPEEFKMKYKIVDFNKYDYFWYPRRGLVQFDVEIEKGQVVKADSYIIGLMGLDFPPL